MLELLKRYLNTFKTRGCIDDTISTLDYAFSLGLGVFAWCSKKQ